MDALVTDNLHKSTSLKRGSREPITNLLSSFGDLKETNLSAMLGYLISINPILAKKLFNIDLPLIGVSLELRSENKENRYDIVIENSKAEYLVEIKIGRHSPTQLHRYLKSSKNIFVVGESLQSHVAKKSLRKVFLNWEQIAKGLESAKQNGRKKDLYYDKLCDDFIIHLKENGMHKGKIEDVYLRDLSGDSVEMYFNQRIYKCQPQYYDKGKNARFFAPYLTKSNSKSSGLSVFRSLGFGISFVSRIKDCLLILPKDLVSVLDKNGYSKNDIKEIFEKFNWKMNSRREEMVLLLDPPLRLFQRPVTKPDIWGGATGAMPAFCIDFGDLIAASNGLEPLSQKNKKKRKKKA